MSMTIRIEAPLVWGYEWEDGTVLNVIEKDRPRKVGKRAYTSAMQAVGAKAIRVRIIRDSDFQRLKRAAQRR